MKPVTTLRQRRSGLPRVRPQALAVILAGSLLSVPSTLAGPLRAGAPLASATVTTAAERVPQQPLAAEVPASTMAKPQEPQKEQPQAMGESEAEGEAGGPPAPRPVQLVDDVGRSVRLPQPARRIISLAPHITEDLFAAGAGAYVVGVSDYSDYPEAAKALPRVGSMAHYDLEAMAALKPDLIIAWESGIASGHVARLKALKVPVYISKPRHLEDVAVTIERFGELAATSEVALGVAAAYRQRLAGLRSRYAGRAPVRTFYQVWHQPLSTVNGQTLIGDVMRLCGGENVFEQLKVPAPVVTLEAVLVANPEVIIANGMEEVRSNGLEMWKHWRDLRARKRNNLYFIPPDPINRHSPRILDGAQIMCELLDKARAKRKPVSADEGRLRQGRMVQSGTK